MKREVLEDVAKGVLLGEALLYAASIHAHREMSHGSLQLAKPLRDVARFALLFGTGIDSRQYAAVHAYHHATADTEQDPHSPRHKGKLAVLFGTGLLSRKAREQIPDILDQTNIFEHRGGEADAAFERNEDGSIELRPHRLDELLKRGGVAYGIGLGACMAMLDVRRGATVFGVSTATFLGVTGAINLWGHSSNQKIHFDIPGSNLPGWTSIPTAGEGPGHNNHHFDPSNPRIPESDVSDPAFTIVRLLEKTHLAKLS